MCNWQPVSMSACLATSCLASIRRSLMLLELTTVDVVVNGMLLMSGKRRILSSVSGWLTVIGDNAGTSRPLGPIISSGPRFGLLTASIDLWPLSTPRNSVGPAPTRLSAPSLPSSACTRLM